MSNNYIDPYEVLGLSPAATPEEIKRAYFALVRANPPEREPERFKRIRSAYERLRDPEKRLETDMLLLQPLPEPSRRRRVPRFNPAVVAEDLFAVARATSDLERKDWREHFMKVTL